MNEEMKGYWKYFAILVAGSVLNLVGGILGKTPLGYILFFVGLAVVIAGFVFVFLKKDYFKADRLKVLILGLVLAILLGASITLLMNSTFVRPTSSGNALFSGMSGTRRASNFGSGTGTFRNNSGTTTQSATGTTSARTAAGGGGLLGVLLGWVLLLAGGILLLVTAIRLLTKKVSYAGNRWKVLLLGLLVGAMLSSSTALLLTRHSRQSGFPGQMPSGQNFPGANGTMMPPDGTPGAVPAGQATATVAATVAPTATATPAPTSTTAPTATATTQTYTSLVVCLDYDQQVGENIRTSPLETGTIVGTIPMAGCFTVDGKNSQYPGWYHFASGQNGMGGISISAYADQDNLWVYNHHFDKGQNWLDGLAEVPYTPATTATPTVNATVAVSATPTK